MIRLIDLKLYFMYSAITIGKEIQKSKNNYIRHGIIRKIIIIVINNKVYLYII